MVNSPILALEYFDIRPLILCFALEHIWSRRLHLLLPLLYLL